MSPCSHGAVRLPALNKSSFARVCPSTRRSISLIEALGHSGRTRLRLRKITLLQIKPATQQGKTQQDTSLPLSLSIVKLS
jgi:hypothetical protein